MDEFRKVQFYKKLEL